MLIVCLNVQLAIFVQLISKPIPCINSKGKIQMPVAVSLCHYQCVFKKREFYRCYHLNKLRKKNFLPLQNRHFEDGHANFNNSIPVVPSLILGLHYFLSVVDMFDLCPNRD